MDRTEIIEDVASQRLYFSAPEGRPTATPTVGTKDQGGGVLTAAADTYVTQDSVNTTITASAAAGAESLTVASATGITVGKSYRLLSKYGRVEWVTVDGVNSTTVYLRSPLQTAFDVVASLSYGDFESTEFYYTFQSGDYDTLRDLAIATATYAVGGLTYKARQAFDVVKVPLPNILTPQAIYDRLGFDLANMDPRRGSDFETQRTEAWKIVKRRIYQHCTEVEQWRPAMVVDPTDLFEWGIAVFTRLCHEQGISVIRTEPAASDLAASEEIERERALRGVSFLDRDDNESKGEDEHMPAQVVFRR